MTHALRSIQSYGLYYGVGGEEYLSRYDLAIVDPGGRGLSGVRRLKSRGSIALAYVSVLEVPRLPTAAPPAHVLTHEGKPLANETFNNWILDPRSPRTSQRMQELIQKALQLEYDGVFLDCLDDVESPLVPASMRMELLPATAWLVQEASQLKCAVVQNWGLHHLLPLTAHVIDGICYEDFPYREVGMIPAMHSGIRFLQKVQTDLGVRVLALNHSITDLDSAAVARDTAERCGFTWYGTSTYTDLPPGVRR
jgi:hypothetical protein